MFEIVAKLNFPTLEKVERIITTSERRPKTAKGMGREKTGRFEGLPVTISQFTCNNKRHPYRITARTTPKRRIVDGTTVRYGSVRQGSTVRAAVPYGTVVRLRFSVTL